MQLKKILEEMEQYRRRAVENGDFNVAAAHEKDMNIIRKHMNDGWIPVEERLPEDEIPTPKLVTALVPDRKARWDNSETFSVIVDTDVYDPEYTRKWECYKENVIAWRPLPDPYRPERSKEE